MVDGLGELRTSGHASTTKGHMFRVVQQVSKTLELNLLAMTTRTEVRRASNGNRR